MKKFSLLVAASFTLLSFSAFAGSNCIYGQDKNLAEAAVEDALIAENIAEKVDPALLAILKKQQAEKEQIKPIIAFN